MILQRLVSRCSARTRFSGQHQRLLGPSCHPSVKFSDESSKPFSQITQKRDLSSENLRGLQQFSTRKDYGPVETNRNSQQFQGSTQPPIAATRNSGLPEGLSQRLAEHTRAPIETSSNTRPFGRAPGAGESGSMNFVRGILRDNISEISQSYRSGMEKNADIVHIKLMRNNTFVTVTDSKGNKKTGASAGCLAEMKGGPKVSKYAAEATAEHVGRVAKSMGLKSVVMKVNGFTFFKRKKLAILSFRDGYTHSRSDRNPIVYIEDTTRKPHNGCRLKKQRRV